MNREQFIKILEEYYSTSPPVKYCLAIDFDKTLCDSIYPNLGDEVVPICNFVRSIQDLDVIIILNTCRTGIALANAIHWCDEHNIKYDYINGNDPYRILEYGADSRKISCNMLIDDTCYNFDINDFKE